MKTAHGASVHFGRCQLAFAVLDNMYLLGSVELSHADLTLADVYKCVNILSL